MQVAVQETTAIAEDIMSKARQRFRVGRVGGTFVYPFLSGAMFTLSPIPVEGLRHKGGIWAVDKRGNVYYDPESILGLCEHKLSIENNIAVLIHEVWHILRNHHDRFDALLDGEHKRWNIAADAEINGADDYIREHMPDFGVLPEKLVGGGVNWPEGKPLPLNKTAEQYYAWLEEDGEEGGEEEEEEGGTKRPKRKGKNPGVLPTDDLFGGEDDWRLPPDEGLTDEELEDVRDNAAREIRNSSNTQGKTPGSWSEWAGARLETPKVPWQQLLSQFIRHALEITSGSSNYTYQRRSRRQSVMSGGVVLPATYRPKLEVSIVIDTSGSMSDGDLNEVLSEVEGVLQVCGASARVICADTRITAAKRITSASQIVCAGRGGTDLRAAIVEAAKGGDGCNKPNAILIFTDGYTPWPYRDDMRNVPVFVGLVGNNCGVNSVPGWMESLVLKD